MTSDDWHYPDHDEPCAEVAAISQDNPMYDDEWIASYCMGRVSLGIAKRGELQSPGFKFDFMRKRAVRVEFDFCLETSRARSG